MRSHGSATLADLVSEAGAGTELAAYWKIVASRPLPLLRSWLMTMPILMLWFSNPSWVDGRPKLVVPLRSPLPRRKHMWNLARGVYKAQMAAHPSFTTCCGYLWEHWYFFYHCQRWQGSQDLTSWSMVSRNQTLWVTTDWWLQSHLSYTGVRRCRSRPPWANGFKTFYPSWTGRDTPTTNIPSLWRTQRLGQEGGQTYNLHGQQPTGCHRRTTVATSWIARHPWWPGQRPVGICSLGDGTWSISPCFLWLDNQVGEKPSSKDGSIEPMVDNHLMAIGSGTQRWQIMGWSSGSHTERLWHFHRMHGTWPGEYRETSQEWWQIQHWSSTWQIQRQVQGATTSAILYTWRQRGLPWFIPL